MSRPNAEVRTASHGRGGAGNINARPENTGTNPADLQTPTIKQNMYTTGRGGSGNMASNDNPDNARLAQDVAAPEHHLKEREGWHHWGRGGGGNLTNLGGGDKAKPRPTSKSGERSGSFSGIVDKGREMLGLNKKKESSPRVDETAVE